MKLKTNSFFQIIEQTLQALVFLSTELGLYFKMKQKSNTVKWKIF